MKSRRLGNKKMEKVYPKSTEDIFSNTVDEQWYSSMDANPRLGREQKQWGP